MAETQSAPSLRELSEAATPGRLDLQAFDLDCHGVPLIAVSDDIPVGGTPTNGLVAVAALLPMEWPSDRNEADPRRAQANAAYLSRLWTDHRAGRLIDPNTLTKAVAAARAEGQRNALVWLRREVILLCEHAEDRAHAELEKPTLIEHERGFHKGAYTEAKGIRRAIAEAVRCRLADLPAPPTTPGGRTDG